MASKDELKKLIIGAQDLNDLNLSLKSTFEQVIALQENYRNRQEIILELTKNISDLDADQVKKLDAIIDDQKKEDKLLNDKTKKLREHNNQYNIQKKITQTINSTLKSMYKYLVDSDKVIRQTNLELGLSGVRAEMMRTSFEGSAREVYYMGGTLEDVKNIMTGVADETGRVAILASESVDAIAQIGKGTGLGIEQAAKLAGQFEYMGLNAQNTMKYVQGTVDTTERMGINTIKVLKNVNDNFSKLNTFTFQNGTESIKQMAISAEKTRVSMESALDIAESSRKLENVIELGANLQIMGGEFAKFDPLHWLYTVRNEPEKIQGKISEMTRGLTQLRKKSDGTFETFITPADRDRMSFVAKQLNMTNEELKLISDRRFVLDSMGDQLRGLDISEELSEYISNVAKLNKNTGKYAVNVNNSLVDIADLTETQARVFEKEQKTLKERAVEARTFDDALKDTINELKSILLPILKSVDGVLKAVRPVTEKLVDVFERWTDGSVLKAAGMFLAGATIFKVALGAGGQGMRLMGDYVAGKFEGDGGKFAKTTRRGGVLNRSRAKRATGKGGMGAGATALGIGAGIGLAAAGISTLAEAMDGLDVEKAKVLRDIVITLGLAIGLTTAIAAGIIVFGAATAAAAPALYAFGGAALMVGGAIAIAAAGIGFAAKGFSQLFDSMKDSENITKAALGMTTMVSALAASTFVLPQALGLSMVINRMGKNADNLVKVGNAFKEIKAVLSGSKEDFQAVENMLTSIGNINLKKNNVISQLTDLLKKPLKVEFNDKKVAVVSEITLNIDGEKFMRKVYKPNDAAIQTINASKGKRTK